MRSHSDRYWSISSRRSRNRPSVYVFQVHDRGCWFREVQDDKRSHRPRVHPDTGAEHLERHGVPAGHMQQVRDLLSQHVRGAPQPLQRMFLDDGIHHEQGRPVEDLLPLTAALDSALDIIRVTVQAGLLEQPCIAGRLQQPRDYERLVGADLGRLSLQLDI